MADLKVAAYAKSVGIAADQLINAVLGGRPSETLSPRLPPRRVGWPNRLAARRLVHQQTVLVAEKPLPGRIRRRRQPMHIQK